MNRSSPFLLLGEPLALDLVNTRVHRNGTDVDLLDRPAALDQWLRTQRARIDWRGRTGERELAALRHLRDTMDALLRAHLTRRRAPPTAVEALNRALARPVPGMQLAWHTDRPRKTTPGTDAHLNSLLRKLAVSALDLLTGPDAGRVRQCAHPDCILLFLARNPRRRWCSSATCGNRVRVARHYHKATA